jgi:hypothetical protein
MTPHSECNWPSPNSVASLGHRRHNSQCRLAHLRPSKVLLGQQQRALTVGFTTRRPQDAAPLLEVRLWRELSDAWV